MPAPSFLVVLPWELDRVGGVNQVARDLLRRLERDGTWRPALLVSSWHHREPQIAHDGARITIRARLGAAGWGALKRPLAMARMLRSLHRLDRILARQRVEVVNLHYPNSYVWSFIWLRRLGRRFRLILSFHGMDLEAIRRATPLERRGWERALARCDAVVCCSAFLARELSELAPGARDRVVVIHNGIDPEATLREMDAASAPPPGDRPYVACVATFESKKGLDVLVRAFARVAAALADTDLVIVGREESEHAEIERLVEGAGLAGRVHLFTDVPHAAALRIIRSARALVLPSRREPFGLVLLEAGLLGVPIVASSVGGIPEVVLEGQTGRLVPPEDERALADAIAAAVRERDESRRLGDAMRERVLKQFSWDAAFEKYRAVALGQPDARGS
jgi:glycosyltransferase involved in cell wall biosynthesis